MSSAAGRYRGRVSASAFWLDVAVIGEAAARDRVVSQWVPGAALLLLDDGWLLTLPAVVDARAERAIGVPLRLDNGGLAGPGLIAPAGEVALERGGVVLRAGLADLVAVPMSTWLDRSALAEHALDRCDQPAPNPVVPQSVPVPQVDLRKFAGLGPSTSNGLDGTGWSDGRRWLWPSLALVAVCIVVGIALLIANRGSGRSTVAVSSTSASATAAPTPRVDPTSPPAIVLTVTEPNGIATITFPSLGSTNGSSSPSSWSAAPIIPIGAVVVWALIRLAARAASPRTAGGGRSVTPKANRGWLARMMWRSPARGFVSRKHERYLHKLTREFERRNFDDALRDAIALGGGRGGSMNLRLPKRRDSLALGRPGGSGSAPYSLTVYQHLRALYEKAAADLEAANRIPEAAFAHSELLHDTRAAVALLERHGQLQVAAELAEVRKLETPLVVRLWWRAGNRTRAVDVARSRGAFAAAITRLAEVDPAAAIELRAVWVTSRRAAGDHLGAVEAAWPEPSLRGLVLGSINAGIDLGGSDSARLRAYQVTANPTAANTDTALELLATTDQLDRTSRQLFITTLATLTADDRRTDRQLTSAALRTIMRDGGVIDGRSNIAARSTIETLRKRADPLLRVDLPPINGRRPAAGSPVEADLDRAPGQLPVFDAAVLGPDLLLLAHGDLGVRLVNLAGRTRARWDIATHQLVVADNGGSALLIAHAGANQQLHRLDLTTRRVQDGPTLRLKSVVRSFDGSMLVTVDENGIALLDVLSETPRIVWRELDRSTQILRLNRTATMLAALLSIPSPMNPAIRSVQFWSWELPSMMLRVRRVIENVDIVDATVADSALVLLERSPDGPADLRRYDRYADPEMIEGGVAIDSWLQACGPLVAHCSPSADSGVSVVVYDQQQPVLRSRVAIGAAIGVREHDGRLVLWTEVGQVLAIDRAGPQILANFRTVI